MDASQKQELLDRLKTSGLLFEVLNLSGKEIIVHEATGHTSRRIGVLSHEIESSTDVSESVKNSLFTLYIPLVACSEGDVPSNPDDFFWMKNEDIEEWLRVARKINPKIFALLDLQEKQIEAIMLTEAQLAKKKRKRTKSKASS